VDKTAQDWIGAGGDGAGEGGLNDTLPPNKNSPIIIFRAGLGWAVLSFQGGDGRPAGHLGT